MKGASEHARALLDLAEVEHAEEEVFDFFPDVEPASEEDEHMADTRRVGRALAMIEHARLWEAAGFPSIVHFVKALGVAPSVVAMVERIFPPSEPTTASDRPTSDTKRSE